MQVDVNKGAVLILPGRKNHLERTEAKGLTHRNKCIYYLKEGRSHRKRKTVRV